MFSIVFYTYWGNIKLAICFCRIARIHVFCCVLHVLGQCQTSDLLLRDRPNSCFLLRFTRIGVVSGWSESTMKGSSRWLAGSWIAEKNNDITCFLWFLASKFGVWLVVPVTEYSALTFVNTSHALYKFQTILTLLVWGVSPELCLGNGDTPGTALECAQRKCNQPYMYRRERYR